MRETCPSAFGYTPGVNLVCGWAMYVLATVCGFAAHLSAHPRAAAIALAVGVLPMGLFHATIGAFGRRPPETAGH